MNDDLQDEKQKLSDAQNNLTQEQASLLLFETECSKLQSNLEGERNKLNLFESSIG